jgi:hypothetical protein
MSLRSEFKADLPDKKQSAGIRFVARKFQREIEKRIPPAEVEQFSGAGLTGVYPERGRGANGESST